MENIIKCYLGVDFKNCRYYFCEMPESGPTLLPLFGDKDVSNKIPSEFRNELLKQIHRIIIDAMKNKKIDSTEFALHSEYAWLRFDYVEECVVPLFASKECTPYSMKTRNSYYIEYDFNNTTSTMPYCFRLMPESGKPNTSAIGDFCVKQEKIPFDFRMKMRDLICKIYYSSYKDKSNEYYVYKCDDKYSSEYGNSSDTWLHFFIDKGIKTPLITPDDISIEGSKLFNL